MPPDISSPTGATTTAMSVRDAIFAVCAIVVGGAGLWITADYAPQARNFPQVMSAIILVAGLAVLVGAFRSGKPAAATDKPGVGAVGPAVGPSTPLPSETENGALERAGMVRGAVPFGAVLIFWAVAVSLGAGYLLPGFVAGMALMAIAGARGPVRIAAGSAGVVAFCFVMFYIVFQTRIPETTMIRSLVAPLRNLI